MLQTPTEEHPQRQAGGRVRGGRVKGFFSKSKMKLFGKVMGLSSEICL